MKSHRILTLVIFLWASTIFILTMENENLKSQIEQMPKVYAPDYKNITQDDDIYGWYANDTLYIDYNNMGYYQDVNP